MPSDMRLQCPSEDTPPSTRPPSVASSAASTSGTPHRSTSMDSLHTNSSTDKPTGEEYIPTRLIRASPKANANALQFIKTGPAMLHKSAKEQMKKAEVVKSLRKTSLQEEEEWQSTQSSSGHSSAFDEGSDWQTNLDKWKSSRRKRNEDVLERVIEVKRFEQQDELENSKGRRKSKTFNEMREEKNRRGRRYNLVVHDNDNNDLSELGLGISKNGSSLSDAPDEPESTRNVDAKSDAGFCTGSDTGSDGVFAEDSISDTSSALGDKREIHDSLESGVSSMPKDGGDVITNGHHVAVSITTTIKSSSNLEGEYTYAKAIEDYKQFAENSVKKRTSSVSSTASGGTKDEERPSSGADNRKIEERLSFFDGLEKASPPAVEPRFLRRERASTKVDLDKRRSMFELRDFDRPLRQDAGKRRSVDVSTSSLRHKVASFENVSETANRVRGWGAVPPRDTRFKEKLASFSLKEKGLGTTTPYKKAPERDQNFYQKLQSFSRLENGGGSSPTEKKDIPEWMSTTIPRTPPDRKNTSWGLMPPAPAPLKDRIASFENLSPSLETSPGRRELSVSMENLHHRSPTSAVEGTRALNGSQSVSSLYPFRRAPSTPFMVVELDEEERAEEQPCIRTNATASRDYEIKPAKENVETKEPKLPTPSDSAIEASSQPEVSQVPPPRVLESPPPRVPDLSSPKLMETIFPQISSLVTPMRTEPESREVLYTGKTPRKLPELPNVSRAQDTTPHFDHQSEVPDISPPQVPDEIPPPVPPPRVPTIEDPHSAQVGMCLEGSSPGSSHSKGEADEGERRKAGDAPREGKVGPTDLQYGDRDIDEVIDNYEHLSEAVTIGEGEAYREASPLSIPSQSSREENVYERIAEDEPVYENIYEKVSDDSETASGAEGSLEHHYQTLEEVNVQKTNLSPSSPVSPTLPPKSKTLSVFEVLDVTWTEDGSSAPAAPPSEPPPPPPPEEEGGEEEELEDPTQGGVSSPPSITSSAPPLEKEGRCDKAATSSPPLAKHSLRRQMSDFLGTKPYVEEVNLRPPPDASELLRKEREAERLIVQMQASLSRESPLSDSDFSSGSLAPFGRPRYTWEDRMKADDPKPKVDLDESSDHLEFQAKLAELEQEMEKHDRHVLQKIKGSSINAHEPPVPAPREEVSPPPQYSGKQALSDAQPPLFAESGTSHASSVPPPKQQPASLPLASFPPGAGTLPIQEFYTAPSFTKHEETDTPSTTSSTTTSVGFSTRSKTVQENAFTESATMIRAFETKRVERTDVASPKTAQQAPPPLPRKSILALSAIPKPRLTDNDSWIMKKKEATKKDYSKHWLIQEAEQRRLEQQDRISRPSQLPINKSANSFQSAPGNQNHFQNIKPSFHNTSPTTYNSTSRSSSSSSNSSSISISRPSTTYQNGPNPLVHPVHDSSKKHTSNAYSSTPPSTTTTTTTTTTTSAHNTNNNWKKQTKTYQPPQPSPPTGSNKPLPDAIINTITQRVNNKNKMNGSARPTVYSSSSTASFRSDDSYHDYMNTDSFSAVHNNNIHAGPPPVVPQGSQQQGLGSGPPLPVGTYPPGPGHANEDQRLLSVSGKKKCSHCGEELGRGAAMIIESLRLFYHIPCFKCCVCGTQLGNGTSGADVRVRNHKLHCHNCYSNDEGMKFSKV